MFERFVTLMREGVDSQAPSARCQILFRLLAVLLFGLLGLTSANSQVLLTNIAKIVAGGANTCTLTAAGGVQCWGRNDYGQLGNNSNTDSWVPTDVNGLTSGVAAISAGGQHTCALTTAGGVKCWGFNIFGELGNNSTSSSPVPVDVVGLTSGVTAISVGAFHTCAFTSSGAVKCWGYNGNGELGNNLTTSSPVPVDVAGLTNGVTAISAGAFYTCAVTKGGGIKCWGSNLYGQIGNNSATDSLVPADVTGLTSGVSGIAAGTMHTCAITTAGTVKCWGNNGASELGNNSNTNSQVPVDVSGLTSGVIAITAGLQHTCALTTAGAVQCWGSNLFGQLGNNSNAGRRVPVDVIGLASGVTAISAGGYHTCALTTAGDVKCWGGNDYGQLGNNSSSRSLTPVNVTGMNGGVTAIAAGVYHTCALSTAGGVKCWGYNIYGQLGNNSTTSSAVPVDVTGLTSGVAAITADRYNTCALTTAGGVKCWGYNGMGELGNNSTTNSPVPVDVTGLTSGVATISAGNFHTCALTTGGAVKCWGYNGNGELGNNSTTNSPVPVDVTGLTSGVSAIAAGGVHTCAITTAGAVKCWGGNASGELGNNTTTGSPVPVDVAGLTSGVIAVAAGQEHACALTTPGAVKCWGKNANGQLGNSSTTNSSVPVNVTGLASGVAAVVAGSYDTCALTTVGGVKCWGYNVSGQLGNNSAVGGPVPIDVSGLSSWVIALAAGMEHTCALTTAGGVKCWGSNGFGQLGNNSTTNTLVPVDVQISKAISFAQGWSLLGNSLNQAFSVAPVLSDASPVITVWKWDVITSNWQFYAPSMDAPTLQAYATSKGYGVLSMINPGEGYWINAKIPGSLAAQAGTAFTLTSANLATGWNLVATGKDILPAAFNLSLSPTPPSPGTVPINLTTLWAWDNDLMQWYFYAPSLEAGGGLSAYITVKNYLDFGTKGKTLGGDVGFWVNRQ